MIKLDDKDLKTDLERKFHELRDKLMGLEGRYFHLNTTENLIYHFDELKNEEDRIWVYTSLSKYLEANNNHLYDMTSKKASEIYNSHLLKVVGFYAEHHRFTFIIGKRFLIPFYLILFVILYFMTTFIISLIPLMLFVVHYLYLINKYRQKRVFGLFF